MTRRLFVYMTCPIIVAIAAFMCESATDKGLCPDTSASVMMITGVVTVLVSLSAMISSFTIWKQKGNLIIFSLNAAAMMVILDYYINIGNGSSGNLLWLLPMVTLVYVAKYNTAVKG